MINWKNYELCDKMISITVVKERSNTPFVVTKNKYITPDEERKIEVQIEYYE
jgi:hypothetical protein